MKASPIKILFLAANPLDTGSRLRLDEEFREIDLNIRQGRLREKFELECAWAVRAGDLHELLLRHQPNIVHFSGHGERGEGIVLEDAAGNGKVANRQAVADLFRILKDDIRMVMLNTCYASDQAKAISESIDFTVGTIGAIQDRSAIAFASSFYRSLAFGRSVKESFELGVNELELEGLDDAHVPKLMVKFGVDPVRSYLLYGTHLNPSQQPLQTTIDVGADIQPDGESRDARINLYPATASEPQVLPKALAGERVRNDIPALQNEPANLERLAAQRAIFWRAKRWLAVQMVCTILVVIALSVLAAVFPNFSPWAALAGLAILSLDSCVFEPVQAGLRLRAARIQERLDCGLFGIEWRPLLAGCGPADEQLVEDVCTYGQAYRKTDPDCEKLKDWYPTEVGKLPLCAARIVCQRSNIRWDLKLRQRYSHIVLGAVSFVLFAALTAAFLRHQTVPDLILTLATLSPFLGWGMRESHREKRCADNLSRLSGHAGDLWESVLMGRIGDEECNRRCRELQDAIFEDRKESPLVFEWLHRLLQPRSERRMRPTASQMIEEFRGNPWSMEPFECSHGQVIRAGTQDFRDQ